MSFKQISLFSKDQLSMEIPKYFPGLSCTSRGWLRTTLRESPSECFRWLLLYVLCWYSSCSESKTWYIYIYKYVCIYIYICIGLLVVEPYPLKNLSASVGMMTFRNHQPEVYIGYCLPYHHELSHSTYPYPIS